MPQLPQQNSAVEEVFQGLDVTKHAVERRYSSEVVEVSQSRQPHRVLRSQTSGEVAPQQQAPTPPPPVVYRRHPKSHLNGSANLMSSAMPGKKAAIAPMPSSLASGLLLVTGSKADDNTQVAPRYCSKHSTTENRPKTNLRRATCLGCSAVRETTYAEFAFCASCTNLQEKCMLCGGYAPEAGDYVPAAKGTIVPPKLGRTTPYAVRERVRQ